MMKSRFSRFLLRSQGAAISEAELIHFFQAQRSVPLVPDRRLRWVRVHSLLSRQ
jgi:hypothetical protein